MIKFILFFFFVCLATWGLMYSAKELIKTPEQFAKVAKVIGIGSVVVLIAAVSVISFVMVF